MPAPLKSHPEGRSRNGYGHCGDSAWAVSAVLQGQRVVPFPFFPMGQYFKAVNEDKKEVVCPWCLGGGAKLWEWAANPYGAIFTLLLRKSDEGGGGDFYGYHKGCDEGGPIRCPVSSIAGRWAGDRVMLVGDYDGSDIWKRLPQYQNITRELVEVWNDFIGIGDLKLKYNPECSCREDC